MDLKLAKRYGEILKQEVSVLEARHNVEKRRTAHSDQRNARRTSSKLNGWRHLYAIQKGIDSSNRPADQKFNARIYSKIDDDVWDRTEMRGWYQQYAVPLPRESQDSVAEGFMAQEKPMNQSRSFRSAKQSQHEFAPVLKSPIRTSTEPHYLDFEGNLKAQQEASQRFLAARSNFPPPVQTLRDAPGVERVVGFRRAPWKDRPHG